MTQALTSPPPVEAARGYSVAILGNPNSGKTTLFNALTGYHQRVGNYPGVTVERKSGRLRGGHDETRIEIVDLPGLYSLSASSPDEAIALDVLLGDQPGHARPDAVVCVVDATNLSRHLFLVSQVMELGLPVVVALNMVDLAQRAGLRIDAPLLAHRLGVRVVPLVATRGRGLDALRGAIADAVRGPQPAEAPTVLGEAVRVTLDELAERVEADAAPAASVRARLLQALLHRGGIHEMRLVRRTPGLATTLCDARLRLTPDDATLAQYEARFRYAWIERVLDGVIDRTEGDSRSSRTDALDRLVTHPVAGSALFLLIMVVVFQSIYTWAGPLMDAISDGFSAVGAAVAAVLPEGALASLVVDGVVAGVGGVLVFLPQIMVLFLFLALLEDCGYMARAAMLAHRFMSPLGLSGKSFIPLLSSFACAIPGIMATRTIEQPRDRLVTMLIAPLMSCSARLPVYVLLIGAFIPATPLLGGVMNLQALVLLSMYLIGVVVAVIVAVVMRRVLGGGPTAPLLIELPSYKWPSARTVLYRVYEQAKAFVTQAGTIILAVTVIIWALGYYPRPESIAEAHEARRETLRIQSPAVTAPAADGETTEDPLAEAIAVVDREEAGAYLRQSWLGRMGHWIEPVVRPLGWDWRIGTAVIASFPAREVVVATMGTIYNLGAEQDEESADLKSTLQAAEWPDGSKVFTLPVALSIMVFFALCCQCGATLAVMKRETNSWRWPVFTFVYMTGLAYTAAWATYALASAWS